MRGEQNLISVIQLGTIDYATGLRLQQRLVSLRKEGKIGDVLLLLEHKPVITLGRNAKSTNVIASPELLAQRGVELFECDRGGDVTFHGPGQLVGYPIFDLRGYANSQSLSSRAEEDEDVEPANRPLQSRDLAFAPRKHLGAVDFVRRLEEVLIRTSADFAIATKRVPGLTGVWTDFDSSARSNSLSSRAEENDSKNRSLKSRDLLLAGTITGHVGTAAPGCPVEQSLTATLSTGAYSEAKLAAIGVHISRFVTSHGFALNINPDLSYFNLIVPCGITTRPVTSMQKELGKELDLNAVAESISRNFGVVFQSQILWVDSLEALFGFAVSENCECRLP
jgi:lipoyl(octanoyl) transferase